jgi:hypothetical protein
MESSAIPDPSQIPEPSRTPTLQALEAARQKLIQQLEEAPKRFAVENNGHELLTSQAALKNIEHLIKKVRKNRSA